MYIVNLWQINKYHKQKSITDIKRNISDFCVTEGFLIKSVIQIIIFVLRSDFAKKNPN